MINPPVSTKRDPYRGRDPRRRDRADRFNAASHAIETYLNDLFARQKESMRQYTYEEIASATRQPVEVVRRVCFVIDGGSNGMTVLRGNLTLDQAMEEQRGARTE